MKRIAATLLSVILSVTISAQDRTPIDKILEDMSRIVSRVRQDSKLKVNHGDGVLRYVHNELVGKDFLCSKDVCGGEAPAPFENLDPAEIDSINEKSRKVFDGIFGAIRHNLDSLMEFSEESYHFESHSHGTDTITYSLCLENREDSITKLKEDDGSMFFPDAVETVFFKFTANHKPCGKHVRGFGTLGYNKNIFLPNRKSYYFDKEPYLKKITQLLKRKDIQSWNFEWAQSEDYDIKSHLNQELESAETVSISRPDGRESNAGQTLGTMYFIPREKTRMAESIFTSIDSMTLNYTEMHPEQTFMYQYHVKEWVMQYTESNYITQLFEGRTGKGHVSTRVFFGITPKGYYVAIADIENNFCIPKEWAVLKSFVNGKKKYIKKRK